MLRLSFFCVFFHQQKLSFHLFPAFLWPWQFQTKPFPSIVIHKWNSISIKFINARNTTFRWWQFSASRRKDKKDHRDRSRPVQSAEAAKAAYSIHGKPLHVKQSRAKPQHYPKKTLSKLSSTPKQININHDEWDNLCGGLNDNDYWDFVLIALCIYNFFVWCLRKMSFIFRSCLCFFNFSCLIIVYISSSSNSIILFSFLSRFFPNNYNFCKACSL